ncbi:MAG TPA: GAF domain-containing protein, partial [Chloroflexota bacterium]|nr:GAF domain-containing protein [Chloroflexota bacterium]
MESAENLDRQQFAIVAQSTAAIAAAGSIDEALDALLAGMAKLTGADRGGVRLLLEASAPYGACELYFWRAPNHSEWRRIETRVGSNTARVLATGQGEYSVDLGAAAKTGDASAQLALTRDGILSSIIVPLHAAGLVIGTLHADACTAQAFSDAQISPLQLLADHAGGVVEHVRQRSQAESRLRRLEAAQRMSAAVNAAGDLDALLHRLMHEVLETLDAQRGAVLLVDADGRFLRPRMTLGYPPGPFDTIVRPLYRQAD